MIFDGHCDIFTDVLRRRLCGETQVLARHHLPKLRAGGICGGCFVLWVDPPFTDDPAARMAQLLSAVAAEMAECNEAALVTRATEIESVAATERFPILLGVEGLSAIGENVDAIDRLHAFARATPCSPGTKQMRWPPAPKQIRPAGSRSLAGGRWRGWRICTCSWMCRI